MMIIVKITYKLKFIDSYRFMQVNYQTLLLTYLKCKKCKCKKCGNICHKSINGLIKKFPRIYQFCNGNLNKFVLLLRK